MSLRPLSILLACAGAVLSAAPTSAATFSYRFTTNEPFAGGDLAFSYMSEGAAPRDLFIQASQLQNATASIARVRFSNTCSTSGGAVCDLVELFVNTSSGTTQVLRRFRDGALDMAGSSPGLDSIPSSLTVGVAASIPEPGTWLLMLSGFAAAGVALRRRGQQGKRFASTRA